MSAAGPKADRRTLRTRQSLRQALVETIREKGFARSSIRDIADRANVHRGTFYMHYADKYELLEEMIRERFREQLVQSLPPSPRWEPEHVRPLVRTVLECLESKYNHRQPSSRFPADLVDEAIRAELTPVLRKLLDDSRADRLEEGRSTEGRPVEGCSTEKRPAEDRLTGGRPVEGHLTEGRPAENRLTEGRSVENRPAENRPAEGPAAADAELTAAAAGWAIFGAAAKWSREPAVISAGRAADAIMRLLVR